MGLLGSDVVEGEPKLAVEIGANAKTEAEEAAKEELDEALEAATADEPKEPYWKRMKRQSDEAEGASRRGDQVAGPARGHPDPGSSRGEPGGELNEDEPEEARDARKCVALVIRQPVI